MGKLTRKQLRMTRRGATQKPMCESFMSLLSSERVRRRRWWGKKNDVLLAFWVETHPTHEIWVGEMEPKKHATFRVERPQLCRSRNMCCVGAGVCVAWDECGCGYCFVCSALRLWSSWLHKRVLRLNSKRKRGHGGRKISLSSACDRLRPTTHASRPAFGRLAPSGETRTKQLSFLSFYLR